MIEIVSSNTDEELRRKEAERAIAWPLRNLAANMLRIIRGAGKSYELIDQLADLSVALNEYRDAVGHYPTGLEFQQALNIDNDDLLEQLHGDNYDWEVGEQKIVRGSLQIAASTLLGQNTQKSAGDREMFDGLVIIEEIREKNRRARNPPAASTAKIGRRRTKRKPKAKTATDIF